jgi:mRNA interferase MazF
MEGDIALASLPQADGLVKPRPVVLLRKMPPFGDWLVCGISTQLRQRVEGLDGLIEPSEPDFAKSGLKAASVIRLGFLTTLPARRFHGVVGSISHERHQRLLRRLCGLLQPEEAT